MAVKVDQAKLVLNEFASIFQNNLISKDLVTWNKFTGQMNDRNALEVVEQVTPDYTTSFTNSSVRDLTSGVQESVFGSERYKLDQVIGTDMGWGDFEKIRDIESARESQALRKAALRLATDIDAYVIGFAANMPNNWLGDGVSNVAKWDDIASGYTRLKEEGCEDGDLKAVLTYNDKQALGSEMVESNRTGNLEATNVYRDGWQGMVAGLPTHFTQQLPALTVGSRIATATSTTNYSSGDFDNDYRDVAISPAPGQYMTGLLNITGQAGSVTLVDGETFTIEGVFAYDNRAKKQLNHLQEFRVIGDYTASSGEFTNVRYFPAVILTGPHQTVVNTNGGGSTFDGLSIQHKGAAGATLQPRFICDKSAVVCNTADLIMPASGTARRVNLTKVPMSVRMWQDSVFATCEHRIRFDVAIKCDVAADGRRRSVRING